MFYRKSTCDRAITQALDLLLGITFLVPTIAHAARETGESSTVQVANTSSPRNVLWQGSADINSRNLIYGSGGSENEPHGKFTFVKEDLDGTSPKFDVRDEAGHKWKIKLGVEAKPEVAAARLIWAVGYFTKELYFLREVSVDAIPSHVKRGQEFIGTSGLLQNARMERSLNERKKVGQWMWRHNPFNDTPEFNRLRVMMALINNWDLKDQNTAIYQETAGGNSEVLRRIFMVSDLGATFGSTGISWTHAGSKGNLNSFRQTKFIKRVTPTYVDFNVPTRPAMIRFFSLPSFLSRVRLRWIGKHIPRADAREMGETLSHLSREQIRDAFRAAGYSPDEVEGFAKVIEARITELSSL